MKGLREIFLILLMMPFSARAELSGQAVLNKVYGRYDPEEQCWQATDSDAQSYCMKLTQSSQVDTGSGHRLYVLATGCTKDGGMNGVPGLVGIFVAEEQEGKLVITYSNAKIPMGSYGCPPRADWKLVRLGAKDYWGWRTEETLHLGAGSATFGAGAIFAPCAGKNICNLTDFVVTYDDTDSGCLGDGDEKQAATVIESTFDFDRNQSDVGIFPLKITLTGKITGKGFAAKTWTLVFDSKKWTYAQPGDWPLKDIEDGCLADYGSLKVLEK